MLEAMWILVAVVGLVGLDLASMRWGVSSIEGVNNPEWDRRHRWRGFRRV